MFNNKKDSKKITFKEQLMKDWDIQYHYKELKGELWDKGYKIKRLEVVSVDNTDDEIVLVK